MSLKKERVESIIKREVANSIVNKLNDPALKFVSVTDVQVTNDLSYATVYVSFLDDKQKQKGIERLEKVKGMLRTDVSKALSTRRTPDLIFKLDESIEYGSKIENILQKIKDEDKSGE